MPKRDAITNQREQEILREVRLAGGSCRIGFLARQLHVSDETIRRNIKTLEASGLVKKVHGGVSLVGLVSVVEPPFPRRMDRNTEVKKALAAKVADIVENGDSIFLDVGSTMAYVAQALQNHENLYIVTNSTAVAHMLTGRNNNRVFLAGGELRVLDGASFGQDTLSFIKRFNVQYAISSVAAINARSGFMLYDIQEADISSAAIKQAQIGIVVVDSSKFGARAPITIQSPQAFDLLVTDAQPDEAIASMLEKNEISLEIAS
ncbi:MAG TPA: DeoR/GlpR transcriptional regulator [Rhodobacteraceae bacterium]|nr:DeoR/GlpR transcriptional regulator [Paracoccaceae bacterium]